MTGTGSERGAEPAISLKTWIAVGGALLGAFLAVLNIQITNTALPYIEGGISTGGVYGTWISTGPYMLKEYVHDDHITLGSGVGGRTWPLDALPE